MSLIGSFLGWVTERQARGKSYDDFVRALESTGATVNGRFQAAADTPAARTAGRHILGIERWGQSRLRVPLGADFTRDEYDGYAPPAEADMAALAAAWPETRAKTADLARELQAAGVPLSRTVPHNDLGDLSIGAWLSYLISHAGRESRRL